MRISVFSSTCREIRQNLGRFLSIFTIVAIGVGFFAGIRATKPDMEESSNRFYAENNLFDMRVVSTLGFDEADVEALRQLDGASVYPGWFADLEIRSDGSDIVARVYSYSGNGGVNRVSITEGRLPEAADECMIESSSFKSHLNIGDSIVLTGEGSDTLTRTEYTVVGKFLSPIYISASEFGSTTVGDGSIDTALYIPAENFDSEVYTEVYLRFDDAIAAAAYSEAYDSAAAAGEAAVTALADSRKDERYNNLLDEANRQIADGEREISDGEASLANAKQQLKDAESKLADAKARLSAAEREIADGKAALVQNEQLLESSIAAARSELTQNRADFAVQQAAYASGKAAYDAGMTEYEQSAAALKTAAEQLRQLAAAYGEDSDLYRAALAEYEQSSALLTQSKARLDETAAELEQGAQALAAGDAQLDAAEEEIDRREAAGKAELEAARRTLAEAEASYTSGAAEYNAGQAEYASSLAEYNQSEPEALQKLADARQEISDAKAEVAVLSPPEWYVFTRDDTPGYAEYGQNAERIGNIAKIFPVFFLLVAALVCLTTMTRMVDEQRGWIGTLKALGYTGGYIMAKFMLYALSATLLGAIVGLLIGFQLFPNVIIHAYTILYNTPYILTPFRWDMAVWATAISLLCVALTVFLTCRKELSKMPARLMRPKSPQNGKRVLLERITPLWKRLNFSQKVSARNIFRYKKRMLMTLIGIAGCTALTLTGFGVKDSISDIVHLQYEQVWRYNAVVATDGQLSDAELEEIAHAAKASAPDMEMLPVMQKSYTASGPNGSYDATVTVPSDSDRFTDFVRLASRTKEENYALNGSSVIITEKLGVMLGLSVGDTITLQSGAGTPVSFTVGGLTENYVSHYIYMTAAQYETAIQTTPEYSLLYLRYGSDVDEPALSTSLLSYDKVLQFSNLESSRSTFEETLRVLDLVVAVLILSAGALAFVVLFNLTNINITERMRELATLKVLGFYDKEVSMYIFRENIVLTLLGAGLGLILGRVLTAFVVRTAEIDMVMFGRQTKPLSFLLAFIITILFSVIVSLIMHRSMKRIDMIDSLKSVE
ncbi:MAG: FtsX-like permease family protein [Candidatus Howiella sp.]|jgi:putative ABC transport system permease protein